MKRIVVCAIIMLILLTLNAQTPRNPTRAMVYSAFLPGGGQFYNGKYLKSGSFFGVEALLAGAAIYHDGKADSYKDKLKTTTDAILLQEYTNLRKDHQDLRKRYFWLLGIVTVGSMLDAYVDAKLYNFEAEKSKLHLLFEGDNLKLELEF